MLHEESVTMLINKNGKATVQQLKKEENS